MEVNCTPRPATGLSPRLLPIRWSNRIIFLPLLLIAMMIAATSTWAQTAVYQVNSGGGGVSPFIADKYYNGGQTASTSSTVSTSGVANAAPAKVYQTERWGGDSNSNPTSFRYTFSSLTAGTSYTVRLHFAEIYWTKTGQRKFNVAINGTSVLSNFDIVAAAGGANKANVQQFTAVASSSGQIVISYTVGSADAPKSSGIEIISQGGATPTPTPLPTATATPTATSNPTATATPTAKPTATATPTAKPTATATAKPTATPTATPVSGGTTINNVYVTFYGWWDNSPPGNAIAYPGTLHNVATAGGSFSNPSTFATDGIDGEMHGLFGAITVPEPSTWALMLLGFGGLALFAVRRRGFLAIS